MKAETMLGMCVLLNGGGKASRLMNLLSQGVRPELREQRKHLHCPYCS
jgi:hypothetical protein